MKILPSETIIYKTLLTEADLTERLTGIRTDRNRSDGILHIPREKKYQGTISGDTFNIIRSWSYRNSFGPHITGV